MPKGGGMRLKKKKPIRIPGGPKKRTIPKKAPKQPANNANNWVNANANNWVNANANNVSTPSPAVSRYTVNGKVQKRSETWQNNMRSLFNRETSNNVFQQRAQTLRAKYTGGNLNALEQRIKQAQHVRTLPYDPEKAALKELQRRLGKDGKYPRKQPPAAAKGPPALCAKEIAAGKDPFTDPCWGNVRQDPQMQEIITAAQSGQWMCSSGDRLGGNQIVALEAAKMIASNSRVPHAPTDRRGLLVYHNTGSGKTVTAMGIMATYWNSGKEIFFVTTNANSNGNPASEYAKNCLVFYPKMASMVFKGVTLPPKPWSTKAYKAGGALKDWCTGVGGPLIEKKLKGPKGVGQLACSFWRFAGRSREKGLDRLRNASQGAVLIVDEAQNFFKPSKAGEETQALATLTAALRQEAYMKNSDVYLLTATPGDTAQQMMDMINYVRPWGMPAITVQNFVANPKLARGLVSYADVRGDPTRYGQLLTGAPRNEYYEFHPGYYAAFLSMFPGFYGGRGGESRNLNSHPDQSKQFFAKSVAAGCMLSAKTVKSFFKGAEDEFDKLLKTKVDNRTEYVFSEKMRVALQRVVKTPGCQYMYVPDGKTLKGVVWALQNVFKMERINGTRIPNVEETTDDGKSRVVPKVPKEWMTNKPRFYAFYPGTMDGETQKPEQMKAVLDWFKKEENQNGEQVKLFVGTVYEGLDMSYLQTVHLMAPLPSVPDDDQAVGRALRMCGHKPERKQVAVIRYFSVAPRDAENALSSGTAAKQQKIEMGLQNLAKRDERGVNAHVFADALRRGKPLREFAMCLRAQSIECEVDQAQGGVLGAIQFGERTRCGMSKCDVKIDCNAKGGCQIVVPPHVPGKHGPLPTGVSKPVNPSKPQPSKPQPGKPAKPHKLLRPDQLGKPSTKPTGFFSWLFGTKTPNYASLQPAHYIEPVYAKKIKGGLKPLPPRPQPKKIKGGLKPLPPRPQPKKIKGGLKPLPPRPK